jgi:hypothetical protein
VVPEAHGIGERVHREGVLLGALDAEEVDPRAQPQHEVVVGDRRHLCEGDLAPGEVDAGHGGLVDGDVRLLMEQVSQSMAAR